MKAKFDDTKQHLLDTGREIITARGFSSVGLSAILQQANIPKGSFYHYFKSKEQFGEALLTDYFDTYLGDLSSLFTDSTVSAKDRLMRYWERWFHNYCSPDGVQSCLVVKLSAEVADLSESMRIALRDGTDQVVQLLEHCINQANEDGSLNVADPRVTASVLYQTWLGASLLTKLHRNDVHLVVALNTTRSILNL